jgi:hydroxyacylglutathione hydrolase
MVYIIAEVMCVHTLRINDSIRCIVTGPIGTNSYVIDAEPSVVIDPGYGIGAFVQKPCIVLLTHGHFDHICGLKELKVEKLYICEHDAPWLIDPSLNLSLYFGERFVFDFKVELLSDTLTLAGLEFRVYRTPGHTPGSVMFKTNGVIFSGDTIFLDSIGRTDLPGGDEATMRKTLMFVRKLLNSLEPKELVLPGHGEIGTVKEVLKQNLFLGEEER